MARPQRAAWPPLPPPPARFALLSSRSTATAPPHLDSDLYSAKRAETVEEYSMTRDASIFKGGGRYRDDSESASSEADSDDANSDSTADLSPRRENPGSEEEHSVEMILDVKHPFWRKLEVNHHAGVLVVKNRGEPGIVVLESMPFSSRFGCRVLYHGLLGHEKLLNSVGVEKLFRKWSEREGRKFDSPHNVLHRILNYVRAYRVDCRDLLQPDLSRYPTLNSFFFRKLRAGARPIADPGNPFVISSAADCRLTVFSNVSSAQKLWIKGRGFDLAQLVGSKKMARRLDEGCVAIFRLAPADYHRYHAPFKAVVGPTKHLSGKYYTVNSLIVRDRRFNPLGENKRDGLCLESSLAIRCWRTDGTVATVAFVQVGALLVSSIRQTAETGETVERGDELGYFAYGGSTLVAVFERGSVRWDPDVLRNSTGANPLGPVETMVRVGEKIGEWVT
ncbi:hypothetical protein JCM11491_002470 [Sporobolomyces phaffii]